MSLLHDFLRASAARLPDKIALVCGEQRVSFGALQARVQHLAAHLHACGVARGERVALYLDNSPEMVVAIHAVLQLGAVFMPINPLTKGDKLAYVLRDSGAVALLSQANLMADCRTALGPDTPVRSCVLAHWAPDAEGVAPFGAGVQAHPWPECRAALGAVSEDAGGNAWPDPLIDQDLAAIIYTSGSTGRPKGVMLSHLNLISAVNAVAEYLGLTENDVIASALPLAFGYGLNQVLLGCKLGARVVLEPSFAFPVKVLQTLERERATVFPGVPTMYALLTNLKTLPHHDLSSLRVLTNAAAALSTEHIARLRALLPGARLYSMYGQTECTRISYLPPDQLDIRPTSVGRGMPNQECWLIDAEGRRLPHGCSGELVVRGSHVMRGYWRQPEETARRLLPGPLPGEFVLRTGDLFRTDAQGWLYFEARQDDIIKTRGEKVSPREVEDVIYALDAVLEAAVVGVPDALLGQSVKAFVVLKDGAALSEREIIRHCLNKLENYMAPKHVEFVDALPKTLSGKIKKTELA